MKNNGRTDRLEIFKKFERMISENKSIYLDLDEIEEIIIHYFHEANYEMAENAIALANQIFPNSISISCLLYTSPSPRDRTRSRMPSSA